MLNRNYLNVPVGIKFISDWKELELPKGHYILNKIVTGCGFTEYFLNNNIPTILCSPRKALLGNKHRQHKIDGRPTYLYKNKFDTETNMDIGSAEKMSIENVIEDPNQILEYNRDLQGYIETNYNIFNDVIPKILVTYDSLWHVLEVINNISPTLLEQFQVVVDEFQSIFSDASFKATTELGFLTYLQNVPNVCYLSATPVLDRYLSELDEFKNLPYYELVWDSSMITKPVINRKKIVSIPEACYNIIQEYKNGIYPRKYYNNQIIESKEVVFYINSVTDICKIIKKANLKENEVNVICAHDSKNLKKLKKVGIKDYGIVPLKGQPHKQFTFCTRTVYIGTDFYSTNASTVICSDCNLSSMSLDISLDIPQIIGRQRLDENIFKHDVTFFYKTSKLDLSKDKFDELVNKKIKETNTNINLFNSNIEKDQKDLVVSMTRDQVIFNRYKKNYSCVVDTPTGPKIIFNKLVLLSEQRAWELQQLNYKDEVTVLKSLQEEGFDCQLYTEENLVLIQEFLQEFNQDRNFKRCMRLYCSFLDQYPTLFSILLKISEIPNTFHMYYELLGHDGIRAYSYEELPLRNEVEIKLKVPEIRTAILFSFQPGNKYSRGYIKEKLQEIYDQLGFKKKAKAADLEEYFELRRVKIKNSILNKYDEGFEIIQLK